MYERILVPVDGSETSKRGLSEACRLSKRTGGRLKVLHVLDEHYLVNNYVGVVCTPELFEAMRRGGERILDEAAAAARDSGVPVEAVLRQSGGRRVSDAIIDEAKAWPADLVVMGTHGRRGLSHLALGSDAELVVRESPVPVLLVCAKGAAEK